MSQDKKIKQTKSESALPDSLISRSVSASVADAVSALQNNAVRTSTECKGGLVRLDTTYPPELVKGLRAMFKSDRSYDFEVHGSANLATIAAGVFNTALAMTPGGGTPTYSEWTALAALFDEVVIRRSQLDITSAFGPTSTAIIFQVAVAPDLDATSGATPSYATVQRLAESEFLHPYTMALKPGRFTKVHKFRARPYALTSAPSGASGTPSGCLGNWVFASNIVGTATINYMFAAIKNVLRLRNRA